MIVRLHIVGILPTLVSFSCDGGGGGGGGPSGEPGDPANNSPWGGR